MWWTCSSSLGRSFWIMVQTWCRLRPKYSCTRMFRSATICAPGHLGMTLFEGRGNAAGCLSDHLQVVDHPDLEHLAAQKRIDATRDPLSDFRGGFQNIVQAIRIAPYRAIASR